MFRFRLRTLMIIITIVAAASAFVGRRLYLKRIHQQAVESIKEAGGMILENKSKQVQRVYLGGKKIDDQAIDDLSRHLRNLPSTRELDLVRTPVSDESIELLGQLTFLKELYIFETLITDEGTTRLQALLPNTAVKTEEPAPIATSMMGMNIYRHAITALAVWQKGTRTATGNGAGVISIWGSENQHPTNQWKAHEKWVFDIEISPDQKTFATAGGDDVVKLWNVEDHSLLHQFLEPNNDVHDVTFTPDGSYLIAASDDRLIRIWDLASKRLVQVLKGHRRQIPRIALNPSGTILASASRDETVRLWSIPQGEQLACLAGHTADVMSVTFDRTGRWLASADQSGTVRVWDEPSRTLAREVKTDLGSIFDLTFDGTGKTLWCCGEDGMIRWDVEHGSIHRSAAQTYASRISLDADDQVLLTTNIDGELRKLDATTLETIEIQRTLYGQRELELVQ